MDPLLTREEAARLLKKKPSWMRYSERRRIVPFVHVGRQVRYRLADIQAWLEGQVVR